MLRVIQYEGLKQPAMHQHRFIRIMNLIPGQLPFATIVFRIFVLNPFAILVDIHCQTTCGSLSGEFHLISPITPVKG